jgi:nucleoside-diphosphate-sugar epimerase
MKFKQEVFEKTLVLGYKGMVGSAIVRRMEDQGLPAPVKLP